MEKDAVVQVMVQYLQNLVRLTAGPDLEALTLQNLKIIDAERGFVRCTFTVPDRVSDENGNWQTGAMATVMDGIGAAAVYSADGQIHASVALDISCYSTAKIQEEVEIEAKVVGKKEKLTSAIIEVRKINHGDLIAIGKLWMSPISLNHKDLRQPPSKL